MSELQLTDIQQNHGPNLRQKLGAAFCAAVVMLGVSGSNADLPPDNNGVAAALGTWDCVDDIELTMLPPGACDVMVGSALGKSGSIAMPDGSAYDYERDYPKCLDQQSDRLEQAQLIGYIGGAQTKGDNLDGVAPKIAAEFKRALEVPQIKYIAGKVPRTRIFFSTNGGENASLASDTREISFCFSGVKRAFDLKGEISMAYLHEGWHAIHYNWKDIAKLHTEQGRQTTQDLQELTELFLEDAREILESTRLKYQEDIIDTLKRYKASNAKKKTYTPQLAAALDTLIIQAGIEHGLDDMAASKEDGTDGGIISFNSYASKLAGQLGTRQEIKNLNLDGFMISVVPEYFKYITESKVLGRYSFDGGHPTNVTEWIASSCATIEGDPNTVIMMAQASANHDQLLRFVRQRRIIERLMRRNDPVYAGMSNNAYVIEKLS